MNVSITIPAQTVDTTIPAPQIVYSNSWLGQTSAISSTTIFTPTVGGVYRATVSADAAGVVNAGDVGITLQSSGSTNQFQLTQSATTDGASVSVTGSFIGQSGQSIQISTTEGGTVSSYDLSVVIEQLQ